MRSILSLAIVLLALSAGLRCVVTYGSSARGQRGPERGTSILATSRGALLPDAPIPGGSDLVPEVIIVGDLLLTRPQSGSGLRVALLGPDLELIEFVSLALATEPQHVEFLRKMISQARIGSVLVLAAQGYVRPVSGEIQELDELVERLGARLSPFREKHVSWVLVTCREASGWRPVGEAYSETRSVSLSITLSKRPQQRTRDAASELWYVQADGEMTLDLTKARSWAVSNDRFGFDRRAAIEDEVYPAYRLRAGRLQPGDPLISGTLFWDDVPLGNAPRFETQLGVARESIPEFDSVECQLWVDSSMVASTQLISTTTWTPWAVDLGGYSGRNVRLEMRAVSTSKLDDGVARLDWVLWGKPVLRWVAVR